MGETEELTNIELSDEQRGKFDFAEAPPHTPNIDGSERTQDFSEEEIHQNEFELPPDQAETQLNNMLEDIMSEVTPIYIM